MNKFYVIVRNDMASMTPGRVAAQCTHASDEFHDAMNKTKSKFFKKAFKTWKEDRKFGTAIILEGDYKSIMKYIDETVRHNTHNMMGGMVFDPSYAVKDGATTHFLGVETVGWVFIPDGVNSKPPFELDRREYA